MFIPTDVLLVLALLWLVSCRTEETERQPTAPPPAAVRPRSPTQEPPDLSARIRAWTTYQSIAQARGDWGWADHCRAMVASLHAQTETDRLAYNRMLRTRILGADRAKDFE